MNIAKTLSGIMNNPIVANSLNKNYSIDKTLTANTIKWDRDILKRKPSSAYKETKNGELIYKGTDLDAYTVLSALSKRNVIINLPQGYENIRSTTINLNQRLISKENRHGQLIGLLSNNKTHAFSMRMFDYNIVTNDNIGNEKIGDYRDFMIIDDFGNLNPGFKSLEFKLSDKEQDYATEREIFELPNQFSFKYFTHPNLAMAIYGARYISTKALEKRVTDEKKYFSDLARAILKDTLVSNDYSRKTQHNQKIIPFKQKKNQLQQEGLTKMADADKTQGYVLDAKITFPELSGTYPIIGLTKNGSINNYTSKYSANKSDVLRYAIFQIKKLNREQTQIRCNLKSVEYAFFTDGFSGPKINGNEKMPAWNIPDWKPGYKESTRSRTIWNAINLSDNVNLLYRIKTATAYQRF